jgi:CRP-like cAMP-binding protein
MELILAAIGGWPLGPAEKEALAPCVAGTRSYRRGQTIVKDATTPKLLHMLAKGWAARCQMREDGSRQITDFILPGEICDLTVLAGGMRDVVTALTPAQAILLDRSALLTAMTAQPAIAVLLFKQALKQQSVLRAWLACMGLREKREHVAHLFCELHKRLRRLELVGDHEFDLPLTQADLADTVGMTEVHANRVLRALRQEGVIALEGKHLRILNPARLRDIAEFSDAYLED